MSSTEFSSEGFDLDNLPSDAGDDVVLELGGGVSLVHNGSSREPEELTPPKTEEEKVEEEEEGNEPSPIDKSEEAKQKGNVEFKNGSYLDAYDFYSDAIEACPGLSGRELLQQKEDYESKQHDEALRRHREMDEERRKMRERGEEGEPKPPPPLPAFEAPPHEFGKELAVYHSNRAACSLHLEKFEDARDDCTVAVLLNPRYTKAWVRRSQAYEKLESTEDALADAKTALECDPNNATIRRTVQRLQKLEDERMEKLKEETLGKLKDLGNSILGNFGLSLDNFKTVQDPNTGSYSISFDQNANKASV